MKYFWRVLHYLRPYWKLAAGSVIITLASVVASLLTPWPLKLLVDNVLGGQPVPPILAGLAPAGGGDRTALLVAVIVGGLVVTLTVNLLEVVENYVNTRLNLNMGLDFRGDLFQHAQRLSMSYHDQRQSGMLIYLINFQCGAASGLIMAVPPLAQSVLTLAGMFWITLLIDARLALLSMAIVPFLYYSVGYYIKYIQPRLLHVKGLESETLGIIHEAVSMLRVIVAFARENYEYRRFRGQGVRSVDARVKLTVQQTMFSLAVNMTTAIGTALVLGYGAHHVLWGRLSVGQLLVVMAYVAAVYKPLEAISTTIGSLQDQIVSLRLTFDFLDTEPEIQDVEGARTFVCRWGHVVFKNVHFHYAGRAGTLKGINLEARPGQRIALVGPTGAGKTTLISLMPRFYDPIRGRIEIDGVDIRQVTLKSLRASVSLVQQEPLLFSDTIFNNIRYGRLEATSEEIVAAAKAANAHDFIMGLPAQYETMIGERGAQLSGGERQRISVARAFLKDAPILLLDEPTSSIDSKTEAVILDALERLMEGRTTFMVAHRLSTIRDADQILVVNHGRIVERGTHDELLDNRGLYLQLYEMQTGETLRRAPDRPAEIG
jgi:ABC-type multidrug transport system fused ATPase/permease subunit